MQPLLNMPFDESSCLRLVEPDDADFLFHLRSTQKALKFLSPPPLFIGSSRKMAGGLQNTGESRDRFLFYCH